MKNICFFLAFILFTLGCSPEKQVLLPQNELENNPSLAKDAIPSARVDLSNILGLTVDGNANTVIPTLVPPATPLYYRRTNLPVLGPDGQHITAGEFISVSGTAEFKCVGQGTQVKIHLRGLIPNAEYRIWLLTFKSPGFDLSWPNPFINIIGSGALGPDDRSQNSFKSSASGQGSIVQFMPPGSLSEFGSVSDCLLTDEFEFHFVGAFQQPNQPSGTNVGPPANPAYKFTAVEQFVFVVVP